MRFLTGIAPFILSLGLIGWPFADTRAEHATAGKIGYVAAWCNDMDSFSQLYDQALHNMNRDTYVSLVLQNPDFPCYDIRFMNRPPLQGALVEKITERRMADGRTIEIWSVDFPGRERVSYTWFQKHGSVKSDPA